MPEKTMETMVHELADLEAIRGLTYRYAHHVWRKEGPQIATDLYADDGVYDNGRVVTRGKEALLEYYRDVGRRGTGPGPFPYVHNHVIDLQGDRATGYCYMDQRTTVDDRGVIGGGCYEDAYVRVGDGWRFQSRTYRQLFTLAAGDIVETTR